MSDPWATKGCEVCRAAWRTGTLVPEIAVSIGRHTSLHFCETCQTLWEQHERYVDTIDRSDAKKIYPSFLDVIKK